MSTRSALAGAATTAALVAALGNPGAVDAARDAHDQALGLTLTGFPNWDAADLPGDVVGAIALRLALVLVLVALLCALAGRSRGAALVGGWGALVVAAGTSGAVTYVYQVAVVLDGHTFSSTYLDGLVLAANAGASFGLWTGWLVGLVLALVAQPTPVPRDLATPTTARWPTPAPERRITEPPPPWWAPSHGGADASVRPGPTAFPPGGFVPAPPASASPGAGAELATTSGDPHPSDPDATQAVGHPPQAERADPDVTTTMPETTDRTMPMRRKPD
jgi:hypothetical protein